MFWHTSSYFHLLCGKKNKTNDSDLKRVLLVVLQSIIQQHAQRHDTAVKFAILRCPVGVYEDGGLVREDVASLSSLAVKLLLTFPFLLLRVRYTSDKRLQTIKRAKPILSEWDATIISSYDCFHLAGDSPQPGIRGKGYKAQTSFPFYKAWHPEVQCIFLYILLVSFVLIPFRCWLQSKTPHVPLT